MANLKPGLELELTPSQIVIELDKYIIGQTDAKKAVAIALRNRSRRKNVDEELREEISPKNIILIGPTGVGKTEVARRLAKLTKAPFIKVEATKFTEVGYVGRDVESIIRDLVSSAINEEKVRASELVKEEAMKQAEEQILDILIPPPNSRQEMQMGDQTSSISSGFPPNGFNPMAANTLNVSLPFGAPPENSKRMGTQPSEGQSKEELEQTYKKAREEKRLAYQKGEFDEEYIELSNDSQPRLKNVFIDFSPEQGMEQLDQMMQSVIGNLAGGGGNSHKKMRVVDAKKYLVSQLSEKLIDMDKTTQTALSHVENMGIVFLDEIDKIANKEAHHGTDVSREGVQRDLLPLVEGCTVNTRYGSVKTDHILFIASGAFHITKPADLIPELQGRFPIRVELESLSVESLEKILTLPKSALLKQYTALLETEGISIKFTSTAIKEIAKIAFEVNQKTFNIGARRLSTIMEKLLEELLFDPLSQGEKVVVDKEYVLKRLEGIRVDQDLSKFIL